MFAASSPGSDQSQSREYIHPMERSPKAVALAGTSAVAPPNLHSDASVFSEGAALAFCIPRSIIAQVRPVKYLAFPSQRKAPPGIDAPQHLRNSQKIPRRS